MSAIELVEAMYNQPQLSVIVATDAPDDIRETLEFYRPALDGLGKSYEFVCVFDGRHGAQMDSLRALERDWPELKVLGQKPWNGVDAAIATAVRRTSADLVLHLPGWPQIDPAELPKLFDALGQQDLVAAARADRPTTGWQGLRQRLFGRVLRSLFGATLSDPFCHVRLIRREPLEDASSFGVREHFIPVIATHRGYSMTEVELRPAPAQGPGDQTYVFKLFGHLRALLDAMTLYIVVTFLRRPLRFFGAIGLPLTVIGGIATAALLFGRIFGDTALADRPALIFAVMTLILGIQIIAIGLIGEIIIFAGSRRMKQYDVQSVIRGSAGSTDAPPEPHSDPNPDPAADPVPETGNTMGKTE